MSKTGNRRKGLVSGRTGDKSGAVSAIALPLIGHLSVTDPVRESPFTDTCCSVPVPGRNSSNVFVTG
jgi:hypothetical protein